MGQKVNPIGLRLGINRTWDSRWFANTGEYGSLLHEDVRIRDALMEDLKQAAVSRVVIRSRSTAASASAREWTPSFRMMFFRCERTVSGERTSMAAT